MIRFSVGLILALVSCSVAAENNVTSDAVFEQPQRLLADGQVIDTGNAWGHSGPCMEDLDSDGLPDLVVGDFSGRFRLYNNIGSRNHPEFQEAGFIQAGEEDASVRIYCCVGSQSRFADLNGDGHRDLISNSYDPGHCFVFYGKPGSSFAQREELLDQADVPIRSSPQQQQDYQSFGSFFTPVDWDADGDIDLLIGCFDGHLKLRINEGTNEQASFATDNQEVSAGGSPLKVEAHCAPVVADWNGDGLWDILSGSDDGSVTWFRNSGSRHKPSFEAGVTLVEKHPDVGYHLLRWNEADIVPGIRSQIEIVDFNDDGKLDLLLGDFCTAYEPRVDLSDDEKEQLEQLISERSKYSKAFADKMEALRADFRERYPDDAIYSDEADKAWSVAYKALKEGPEYQAMEKGESDWVNKVRPLLAKTQGDGERAHDLPISRGYVWLFLRK